MEEYVGYYMLSLTDPSTGDSQQAFKPAPASDHLFTELKPATQYQFKVRTAPVWAFFEADLCNNLVMTFWFWYFQK